VNRFSQKFSDIWNALLGRRTRVLLYHSISDNRDDPYAVTPQVFLEHMTWLRTHRYRVISHGQFLDSFKKGINQPRSVILTFDDGYADFFDVALPVLCKFGFPAIVFIPTGKNNQQSDWTLHHLQKPLMTLEQIQRVTQMGVQVGSHSASHVSLTDIDAETLKKELEDSLRYIKQLPSNTGLCLAYPYGRAGNREQSAAQKAGYDSAYLAGGLWGNGLGSNLFQLTRYLITNRTTRIGFKQIITGIADLTYLFRISYPENIPLGDV
jgi:peptidoglycan/xylan/chitin deacetylase (PgdA/CDA1 family)